MAKQFAWSFSALESFETCPRKHWAERVARVVPFKPNAATEYGKEVHKKFENFLINGATLPLDLRHHEKTLAPLREAKGEGSPEQKLALNRNFQPTGYFDADVWVRVVIDYLKVNGNVALIVDHKTGKEKDNFDQLDLCAAVLSCYMPEVEKFILAFYYTKMKKLHRKTITRADIPAIWNSYYPRVQRLEQAHKEDKWPATPNGLCRQWCGYKDCPHNGGQ